MRSRFLASAKTRRGKSAISTIEPSAATAAFYRTVPLPDGVDPKACNAQFKDGVLEVTVKMPKAMEPKRRRIEIT